MTVTVLTHAEARRRAALIEVWSYDLDLDVTDGLGGAAAERFRSRVTIRFGCRQPGVATFADLAADVVHEIRLNGVPLSQEEHMSGDRLLLDSLAADNELVVDATMRFQTNGEGLNRFVDPLDDRIYLCSMSFLRCAPMIFACFDQPDMKAPYTVRMTVPPGWLAVTNAPVHEVRESPAGGQVVAFARSRPLATYVTAFVAGPYHRVVGKYAGVHGEIELGLVCRQSLAEYLDPDELFAVTRAGFAFYEREFDYPYAFAKYDQVFGPLFTGAMENVGAVVLGEEFVYRSPVTELDRQYRAYVILHEMAHMWFGNLVTTKWWDDTWLNESFATFAGYLSQAESTRWTTAWTRFAHQYKARAIKHDQLGSTHPVAAEVDDLLSAEVNFDWITYAKGASVLKQLVAYVGRESFLRALREYFRDHEFGSATLRDLLAALGRHSGRDMTRWSQQWLQTAQVNTIRGEPVCADDGTLAGFTLVQTADDAHPVLRDHELVVGCYRDEGGSLVRAERVTVRVSGPRTAVPELAGRPLPALILVNDEDLAYAKIRLDEASTRALVERVHQLPDTLSRAVGWGVLWDLTRDGELRAAEYAGHAAAGLPAETDDAILEDLLATAEWACRYYVDGAHRGEVTARFAGAVLASLRAAEPGGDRQRILLRGFLRVAPGTSVGAELDRLPGTVGVPLDSELRWKLVQARVAHGAAGTAEIEAELSVERNAAAEIEAMRARALRPDPKAKAGVWSAMIEDDRLNALERQALVDGFWHPAHAELLGDYVGAYFAGLDGIWARYRGAGTAISLTTGLYPVTADAVTLSAADAWLRDTTRPAAQRRLVADLRDETARAVRNQAR